MTAVIAHADVPLSRELAAVLARAGWDVLRAADPDEAIRLCRECEADVLLVDHALPGGAIELLDRLKRDADLYRIAVILVGDELDVDAVTHAMERGAADVLRTPLDPADAIARASAAARTKALVKELTLQNTRLEDALLFDELTGLRNRRAILQELELLVAGSRRHARDLSVLMIDVDHFKTINDTYGHGAGDDVLRKVARRLSERLREADVAGRLGGDEVLIVLPETDAAGAAVLASDMRAAVARGPVITASGPVDVTISVGSAAWAGDESHVLIERADRALYAAKAAGRDRAVTA